MKTNPKDKALKAHKNSSRQLKTEKLSFLKKHYAKDIQAKQDFNKKHGTFEDRLSKLRGSDYSKYK